MIASAEGGVNIEDISVSKPEAIKILPINVRKGLSEEDALNYVKSLNYTGDLIEQAKDLVLKLYKVFMENDALMLEINPLATVNVNGVLKVMVLDSKVSIDENAKFRQKELSDSVDISNKNSYELEAEKYDLNFIRLDGTIGCLVNGAGKIYFLFNFFFQIQVLLWQLWILSNYMEEIQLISLMLVELPEKKE